MVPTHAIVLELLDVGLGQGLFHDHQVDQVVASQWSNWESQVQQKVALVSLIWLAQSRQVLVSQVLLAGAQVPQPFAGANAQCGLVGELVLQLVEAVMQSVASWAHWQSRCRQRQSLLPNQTHHSRVQVEVPVVLVVVELVEEVEKEMVMKMMMLCWMCEVLVVVVLVHVVHVVALVAEHPRV